jgi:hypothetical protein
MEHESLAEQIERRVREARISRQVRESEQVLLDEIKLLRSALQYALDYEDGQPGCVRNWIMVAIEALEKTK